MSPVIFLFPVSPCSDLLLTVFYSCCIHSFSLYPLFSPLLSGHSTEISLVRSPMTFTLPNPVVMFVLVFPNVSAAFDAVNQSLSPVRYFLCLLPVYHMALDSLLFTLMMIPPPFPDLNGVVLQGFVLGFFIHLTYPWVSVSIPMV